MANLCSTYFISLMVLLLLYILCFFEVQGECGECARAQSVPLCVSKISSWLTRRELDRNRKLMQSLILLREREYSNRDVKVLSRVQGSHVGIDCWNYKDPGPGSFFPSFLSFPFYSNGNLLLFVVFVLTQISKVVFCPNLFCVCEGARACCENSPCPLYGLLLSSFASPSKINTRQGLSRILLRDCPA